MKKIVIAGGGAMGSQIAFQAAYCGYNVTIWLRSENFFEETKKRIDNLYNTYVDTLNLMSTPEGKNEHTWCMGLASKDFVLDELLAKTNFAAKTIKLETNLKQAVENADLVYEAIVEDYDAKVNFYKMVSPLLREDTILATASTSIVPSKLLKGVSNPANFLGFHPSSPLIKNNLVEIMVHEKTSTKVFAEMVDFAESLNLVSVQLLKEQKGYLLNSCLIPFLFAALDLYCKGISNYENIDKAWTKGTGAELGPFQMIDRIGLKTVNDVVNGYRKVPGFSASYDLNGIYKMLKQYVDQGKLGVFTGEGFYKYSK